MKLPKELTTVTRVSRITAVIVLVACIPIGFGLGISYQEIIQLFINQNNKASVATNKPISKPTTPASDATANWKTYKSTRHQYEIKYPPLWKLDEIKATGNIDLASQETKQYGSAKFFVHIAIWNRSTRDFASLEEEARAKGKEFAPCLDVPNAGIAPRGSCVPLQPKTISKKSLPDGNEYYSVVTASNKKIAIIPIVDNSNQFIEIKSVIWPEDANEFFDQILSTFRFLE